MAGIARILGPITLGLATQTLAETYSPMLEEVIVTAQKRSESLQEIPAAINAFSGEDIDAAGWEDLNRLQEAVPSLVINGESKTRSYIAIRGIGTRKFDIGTDASVGMFIDEVYVARFSSALTGIMDLERIEVLKGPQGTLYGRNTIGGAINILTRQPTDEFEARVKAGVGNENAWELSGYVSGGITDDIAARLSLSRSEIDGVLKDTGSGNKGAEENDSARLSVRFEPFDDWRLGFTGDYSKIKSDAVLMEAVPGDDFPIVLVPPTDPRVDAIIARGKEDRYENAYSTPGFVDREFGQYAIKAEHYADWGNFLSISSYSSDDYQEERDFDGTIINAWIHAVDQQSDQFSQEFRLTSSTGGFATFNERLEWVLGVYYFEDDAERVDIHSSEDSILNPPVFEEPIGFTLFDIEVDTVSYAAYSQATYAITDRFNLTAGVRYTKDEKDFTYIGDTNVPTPPVTARFETRDTIDFDSTDPKVALDYAVTDDVMLYASYAEGYKSGGVQFGVGNEANAADSFDEERLSSIEIGMKSRLWGDRLQLNVSAYDYDFEDQQVQQIIEVDGAPIATTENVASSEMNGIELEVLALMTGGLTLDFKYAWQDAEFDEFLSEEGDFSGNQMPAAPEHAYTVALTQELSLGEYGDTILNATYAWKDTQYFNFANEELARQADYGVFNVSAIWRLWDDRSTLRLYCDNCTDEEYLLTFTAFPALFGGGLNNWDYGLRYGLEFTYSF